MDSLPEFFGDERRGRQRNGLLAGRLDSTGAEQRRSGELVAVGRPGLAQCSRYAAVGGLALVDGVPQDDGDADGMPEAAARGADLAQAEWEANE